VTDRELVEGIDYYFDSGLMVFTESYLHERGYCCTNGCRHCPYGFQRADWQERIQHGDPEGVERS